MAAKSNEKKLRQTSEKLERMKLLGIPCNDVKLSRVETKCEESDTNTDSDWVPTPETEQEMDEIEQLDINSQKIPRRLMGNMPAPEFREATLRRHPRRPRPYATERVPSALFNEAVKTTGMPHLLKTEPDKYEYANVKTKKKGFMKMLNARHHHDHWLPTKTKNVDVHYQANIVSPEISNNFKKEQNNIMELFEMANPPCNEFIDMDLTLTKADTKAMIKEKLSGEKSKGQIMHEENTVDMCKQKDFVFHSRPQDDVSELDFPGHAEFLQFLHEVRDSITQNQKLETIAESPLKVDKEAMYKELEEELKSIESCLTSLSSSECTNLSNDSGSYLLVEGKTKVPLDYIRKSVVPFEELQRSRFQMKPIDIEAEENNPFQTLPYSGQLKAQSDLKIDKDVFFTFNTRLRNGLHLRLEVPVENIRQKLIGQGKNKFYSNVATDIDENYVSELKKRVLVKMHQFKTGGAYIKEALRLKFESLLIQGQIVRTKIYDRLNEQNWEKMLKAKALYENLFTKWEKNEYDSVRSIVYQVKNYYETTDKLKREFRELEHQLVLLNMDIVFIEGLWIRRIMLQNFHYLMADQDWRQEHDWIHRISEDDLELESYEESIMKRNIVNIRKREKDDAWAIKTFYKEVFLKNQHPILIVFPDVESFLAGIEDLKLKTFVILLELHYTLWIHTELHERMESFEVWCLQDLQEREVYVSRKCAKLYFMEERAIYLRNYAMQCLNERLDSSFHNYQQNKDRGIIAEVWRNVVPNSAQGSDAFMPDTMLMMLMISDTVLDLINKFDYLDTTKCRKIEADLREERAFQAKQSFQAYQMEKRIEVEMKRVKRSLVPPSQKIKQPVKIRGFRKKEKKMQVVEEAPRISEHTKFFYRAFHDDGDVNQTVEAQDSLLIVENIQEQIVPFYFDHFLKLNGYSPNYNFKTQIEMRDGPEINRIHVKKLIPEIMEKMEKWEIIRKQIMEDNIARNPKMYENVS